MAVISFTAVSNTLTSFVSSGYAGGPWEAALNWANPAAFNQLGLTFPGWARNTTTKEYIRAYGEEKKITG